MIDNDKINEPMTETEKAAENAAGNESDNTSSIGAEAQSAMPEEQENGITEEGKENAVAGSECAGVSAEQCYEWSFFAQQNADAVKEKKSRRRGAAVYAAVVTAMFLICFAALIVLLITGYSGGNAAGGAGGNRIIYVREYDSESGILTVPEVASKCIPSTVGISITTKTGVGTGTGIIMSDDGYIATNYHVIENALSIKVILHDGTVFAGSYIGGDQLSDIALVKIEPKLKKLTPAEFGDSDGLLIGEDIVAIGNPSGLELANSVTNGIVSAINRDVKIYDSNGLVQKRMTLIQISANLNPGNSGGPLIDMYGRVVGINTMRLAETYEGIGFAIPINGAMKILNEIKKNGHYSGSDVAEKGVSLGVICTEVEKGAAVEMTDGPAFIPPVTGIMITDVTVGGSSEGLLKPFDIIVAIDGSKVEYVSEVRSILLNHHVGDVLTLSVFREGSEVKINITLK
ncbi:MAG: trypsin-like peptidase domain-containing protein [Clostridia bacterium]|nr:trypsin-like peptidase domain-containing protein [Clostridia bacterium]